MGLKEKINKVISEQKILFEAKIQSSEEKEEAFSAECRKHLSKIIEFCGELEDAAIPQLKIDVHDTLAVVDIGVYWSHESKTWDTPRKLATWHIGVHTTRTPEGEDLIEEGFKFEEYTYTRGGGHLSHNERIYNTEEVLMDYLIENIGKWVAIVETDYDWDDSKETFN